MITLSLVFSGVILLLHVRNVTAVDFDNDDLPHYDFTPQTLTWDPYDLTPQTLTWDPT